MAKKSMFQKLEEFKRKTHFNEKLGLDDRDNTILSLIQKNPNTPQEEIARKVQLSQPSVGARIRKLQQKGILYNINGVNFRVVDLSLAKIDLNATGTTAIISEFKDCPFFINALITYGECSSLNSLRCNGIWLSLISSKKYSEIYSLCFGCIKIVIYIY